MYGENTDHNLEIKIMAQAVSRRTHHGGRVRTRVSPAFIFFSLLYKMKTGLSNHQPVCKSPINNF
jgi:hypothetical protein